MKKLLKDKQDADKVVSYIRDGTEDTKLRENASMELYEKIQSPITSKIEKLEHKMEDAALPLYDKMMYQNQLSIEDYQQHFIDAPKQKTVTVDISKDINKDVLTKYKLPFKYNSKNGIENIIKNVVIPSRNEISQRKTKITNENKQLQKY